jgi:hypothetical protein
VLARLDREGLSPAKEAQPEKWLRRVFLDVTGLPPSIEDIDSFLQDVAERGDTAYTTTVEKLLTSPRYGECMALDWLDVARYADSHGYNNDSSRSMWRWRDWVIDSFNTNMPYDEFIRQ